jgi:hypothetical protein
MKKEFTIILFCLVCCFLNIFGQDKQNQTKNNQVWNQFISKEGNFKILFPQKPEVSGKELTNSSEKQPSFWFKVHLTEKFFAVNFSENPLFSQFDEDRKKQHYTLFRDYSMNLLNAKLLSDKEIKISGKIGIIINVDGEITTNRILIDDKRIYQIITIVKESQREMNKAETSKFLDSFELLK